MPTRPLNPNATKPVPVVFAGQWVAWTSDHSRIVAHCESMQELWRIVNDRQITDPIFEKVPRSNVRFVGRR